MRPSAVGPFALVVAAWAAWAGPLQAQLHCAKSEVNLGEVKSGVPVRQPFSLVNQGSEVVEIVGIRPSCGCLKPELKQRVVQPGESSTLTLEVNTLTEAAGPHTWRLLVSYRVKGEDRELILQAAARVRAEIQVRPASLTLFTDSTVKHVVTVTDTRPKPLHVKEVQPSSPGVKARLGEPYRDDEGRFVRAVHLEVQADYPEGRRDESLALTTDDPAYAELKVPFTVVKRSRTSVQATPASLDWVGSKDQPLASQRLRLVAGGDEAVVVDRITTDDPAVVCHWAAGPGAHATVRLQLDRAQLRGDGMKTAVYVHLLKPRAETICVPVTWSAR